MQLSSSAREAFVAPTASKARSPSLLNLLAPSCSTKRGRQCLKQWLERPCVDPDVLMERHDTVDAVVSAVSETSAVLWKLSSLFQHVQSYERELALFTSLTRGTADNSADVKLSLADFAGLQKWLSEFQALAERCLGDEDCAIGLGSLYTTRLRPMHDLCSRQLQPFSNLIQEVVASMESSDHLDQDMMKVATESEIKLSTSPLQELRTQIHQCELDVAVGVKQAATLLCIAEDRIKVLYADDEQPNIMRMGIVLRVCRQDSHRVQQQSGEKLSVIRASRASGVWFSTPTIDSLGAKWKSLKRSYEDAEAGLVASLLSEFQANFHDHLNDLAVRVAELDVLVSFALVSHKHKFVRASTSKLLSMIRLQGIFDPFEQHTRNTPSQFSSSTIELSVLEGKTFLLLDGDEKSGQASLLQLLGIVVMLNQLGCFVPCKEALLPVFDAICLRAGAYDQQLYGYSTFMTEMREMSHIFSVMTPTSLVLIEDLCRGTSTSEGLALALSMCLHLMESQTLTCFSSQWRELNDHLAEQPSSTRPMWAPTNNGRSNPRPGDSFQKSSQDSAEFEELMRECDLPADLIARIGDEMHLQGLLKF
ncbi:hypothetical protein PF005_g16894 [Phytophthora fragariae]|uniref:DNA mismatch repair proteins mutS family domain-containing protein n=1 Tax=Phytophthora fragariae TaxID=53985 RepID=A0A6A3EJR6_9STRA|nr:hypothetical protein PF003_g37271 [Phytophthora fragariae]KAE8932151.1 hypothetical protein PF009_g17815 [Phytophthora fragariae]KAE8988773.1 hypothetical protein PF011_g19042 [Phytophthora fragariae]KAE9091064.1 hypothetical protein PF007_g19017 [Phytophthora fragariae]KAE9118660.1 hypothetical protein PF006_g18535 [Phytophthora fragariae]